jgi:glycosyltransferase involved in cell wall biosynthesis
MKNPLVSIVIPLYNCEKYLSACLNSILKQSYQNIEILIADDASTDNSKNIVRTFQKTDSRIVLFENEKNIGLLKNYNLLFAEAKGDYIAVQDADDWADLARISKQVELMERRPEIYLCGTSVAFHYPSGYIRPIVKQQDYELLGPALDYHICPASMMFKKEVLTEVAGLNPFFEGGTSMDRYFINEILSLHRGYFINEVLYHANVRPLSNHKTFSRKKIATLHLCEKFIAQRIESGTDWLKERNYSQIAIHEEKILSDKYIMAEAYRSSAVFNIEFGEYKKAYEGLKNSFRYAITQANLRTFFFLLRSYMKDRWISSLLK